MRLAIENKNVEQWLIVLGIMFTHIVEAAFLFVACAMLLCRTKQALVSVKLLVTFLIISVISIFSLLSLGYNSGKFVQQLILLLYFYISYYIVFGNNVNHLEDFFKKYVKLIYICSILGLIQFAVFAISNINILKIFSSLTVLDAATVTPHIMRIHSVFQEPSGFSTLATPAMFYFFFSTNLKKSERRMRNIIFIAVLLTFSSTATLIIVIGTIFKYVFLSYNKFVRITFICIALISVICFISTISDFEYNKNNETSIISDINRKIAETYNGLSEMDIHAFEHLNLSSYATLSNAWVAINAPNRLMGTGLGTHEQNYYSLYKSDYQYYGLNAQEAYSLFIRIYSEFGIIGICFIILFLLRNYNRSSMINVAILFLIITLLIRGGHYVRNGTVFFFFLYYYTNKQHMSALNYKSNDFTN